MAGNTILSFGRTASTPLGRLWLAASNQGLVAIEQGLNRAEFTAWLARRFNRPAVYAPDRVRAAAQQVEDYLSGRRKEFNLDVDWTLLTPFQQAALRATCAIPRGQTRTYAQIAAQIGRPRAARAVGRAEATNPLPLVIPCHRVVGTDGGLHGYGMAEGLTTKAWLLRMERDEQG
jgi:methylated-DNA-[protein]-cysteine S-methyltransferase